MCSALHHEKATYVVASFLEILKKVYHRIAVDLYLFGYSCILVKIIALPFLDDIPCKKNVLRSLFSVRTEIGNVY